MNCRFRAKHQSPPFELLPGDTALVCEVTGLRGGLRCSAQIHMFVVDQGLRENVLRISGKVK